ncbi:helix-turn-helix domain-containing protein [Clostridium perfringens]
MADKEVLNGNVNALMLSNRIVFNNISIDLDRVEKMVLISLVNHNNWKTGICNPSIKTIQDEWFYKSDREVIKALKSLREKNIISKQTIKRRNYYKLNIALILKDYLQNEGNPQNVGNLQNEGDNIPQNVGNDYPQNEGTNNEITMKEQLNIYSSLENELDTKEIEKDLIKKINSKYSKELIKEELEKLKDKDISKLDLLKELDKNLKSKIKDNSNQDTEEIWSLYPLKKGKASAIKKIPKLLKEYGKEQIIRCIDRYIKYVDNQRKNGFSTLKYKDGSTFFNSGYMDYLDCNYQEDIITKPKEEPKRRGTNLDDL